MGKSWLQPCRFVYLMVHFDFLLSQMTLLKYLISSFNVRIMPGIIQKNISAVYGKEYHLSLPAKSIVALFVYLNLYCYKLA